jgi:hypothetical protein
MRGIDFSNCISTKMREVSADDIGAGAPLSLGNGVAPKTRYDEQGYDN